MSKRSPATTKSESKWFWWTFTISTASYFVYNLVTQEINLLEISAFYFWPSLLSLLITLLASWWKYRLNGRYFFLKECFLFSLGLTVVFAVLIAGLADTWLLVFTFLIGFAIIYALWFGIYIWLFYAPKKMKTALVCLTAAAFMTFLILDISSTISDKGFCASWGIPKPKYIPAPEGYAKVPYPPGTDWDYRWKIASRFCELPIQSLEDSQ